MIQQKAYEWVRELNSNQRSTAAEGHPSVPQHQSLMMLEVINHMDRRVRIANIIADLNVGYGSVQSVIHDHLNFHEVPVRCIP
jgi:hypothetical protein